MCSRATPSILEKRRLRHKSERGDSFYLASALWSYLVWPGKCPHHTMGLMRERWTWSISLLGAWHSAPHTEAPHQIPMVWRKDIIIYTPTTYFNLHRIFLLSSALKPSFWQWQNSQHFPHDVTFFLVHEAFHKSLCAAGEKYRQSSRRAPGVARFYPSPEVISQDPS